MSAPYPPDLTPEPAPPTQADALDPVDVDVLARLERLERKLDWVATRVARIAASPAARYQPAPPQAAAPAGPAQALRPRPSPAAGSPGGAPPDGAPGQAHDPRPHTAPATRPSLAVPGASAATRAVIAAMDAWSPDDAPAVRAQPVSRPGDQAATPRPAPYAPPSRPSPAPYQPPPEQRSEIEDVDALPDWMAQMTQEGNLGRYLLSAAAALLVALAGISLIALTWDSIPDLVKVGSLALLAGGLTAAGTWVAGHRPGLRVAGATLTGTGGVLGFVSAIGAVLLETLPAYPALALMALWALFLLVLSARTRQVFTTVVSTLGALVTVWFATDWAVRTPDQTFLACATTLLYVVLFATGTAVLSEQGRSGRWSPGMPAASLVLTAFTLVRLPVPTFQAASPLVDTLMILATGTLGLCQAAHWSSLLWRNGHRSLTGADWCLGHALVLGAVARVLHGAAQRSLTGATPAAVHGQQTLVILLALVVTGGSALLLLTPFAERAWRQRAAPTVLGASVLLGLVAVSVEPHTYLTTVLVLVVCALSALRVGAFVPLLTLLAAGTALILPGDTLTDVLLLAAGAAVALGGSLLLEYLLPERETADQEPGRENLLTAAAWVAALVLTVLPANLLWRRLPSGDVARTLPVLVAALVVMALVGLGLCARELTPLVLLGGSARGQRAGSPGTPGATTLPTPQIWVTTVASWALAVSLLSVGQADSSWPWKAACAVVVLALCATAVWLMAPWTRDEPGLLLLVTATTTLLVWGTVVALTDVTVQGMTMSGVVLATGTVCIIGGFLRRLTTLRHYGLLVVLAAVLKLAVVDVGTQSSLVRIAALAVGGLVCFLLSLAYNRLAAQEPAPPQAPGATPGAPGTTLPAPGTTPGAPPGPVRPPSAP